MIPVSGITEGKENRSYCIRIVKKVKSERHCGKTTGDSIGVSEIFNHFITSIFGPEFLFYLNSKLESREMYKT